MPDSLMQCMQCKRGMHKSCMSKGCECTHEFRSTADEQDSDDDSAHDVGSKRERRTKPDAALRDQQSTGRKRAARMYPLNRNAICEWAGKSRVGGGDNPITGCSENTQQARHHGPDKNTLNNEPGNVHRICHTCHNRWHAANDPDYDPNKKLKD